MGYVIEGYNKYDKWDREHAVYTFNMNGASFAIKEVRIVDGQPEFPFRLEETDTNTYFIFKSQQEAYEYVRQIKALNCTP